MSVSMGPHEKALLSFLTTGVHSRSFAVKFLGWLVNGEENAEDTRR